MYLIRSNLFIVFIFLSLSNLAEKNDLFKGIVFSDSNQNGIHDFGESGIAGVCVSNGKTVVQTDASGKWELPAENSHSVFVVKPAGYTVPVNQDNIPQHFYLLGEGISSEEIRFPLYPVDENDKFSVLFFGDTQARGLREVNFIMHDVVEECMETDAAFGVSLGDIVADDPSLFAEVSQGIGYIGIPWYNIFGNHDHDRDEKRNENKDKTFRKFFGPSTYAFEYGQIAFIGLNNVFFNKKGKYHAHLSDEQLSFIENYLSFVPEEKLVVLMMHIPLVRIDTRDRLYQMNIYLPDEMSQNELDTANVLVNIFAGSSRSKVEMRVGKNDKWIPMQQVATIDPECLRMHRLSPVLDTEIDGQSLEYGFGYKMDYPSISTHMWQGKLPEKLQPGTHLVTVRTTDMFQQTWTGHRIFRIQEIKNSTKINHE